MKSSKRKICQVLALVVSGMGASLAMAAGPLIQGGGSSLVARRADDRRQLAGFG